MRFEDVASVEIQLVDDQECYLVTVPGRNTTTVMLLSISDSLTMESMPMTSGPDVHCATRNRVQGNRLRLE